MSTTTVENSADVSAEPNGAANLTEEPTAPDAASAPGDKAASEAQASRGTTGDDSTGTEAVGVAPLTGEPTPAETSGLPEAGASGGTQAKDDSATNENSSSSSPTEQIAGLSALKGLILYMAVIAFAALYVYFMVRILQAQSGKPPALDSALVTAAAAFAGVLGSAFALEIGSPTDSRDTNPTLKAALDEREPTKAARVKSWVRLVLSLEPPDTESVSWPKTLGIWTYAIIASAVAITYACNQSETPATIKALAVAFGGYVIALVTRAYGIKAKAS